MTTTPEENRVDRQEMDTVLLAVLGNRFEAIVREMTNTLLRSGRSTVLAVARDFSCAIVTADDELLAATEGLPVHVVGAGLQTRSMTEFHGETLTEGDAFLHNDPYLGNTHTADHTILVPVLIEGEHLFTVLAKAHQADCGNSQPSTYMPFARDVYEEGGLIFPCVQIQRSYRDIEDIIRMCRKRIRIPEIWYGDYLATIGAARIGERRVRELCEKYGAETIKTFCKEWFDYSERRMRHAIAGLPAASFKVTARQDSLPDVPNGIGIAAHVSIDPTRQVIEVDLSDSDDYLPIGLNMSEACAVASAFVPVFNCLDSTLPRNSGSFRRLSVKIREGSIAGGPLFPASCSMATSNLTALFINAIGAGFATLGDEWGLAEGGTSMGGGFGVISGREFRRDGARFVNQLILTTNGGPASPRNDGWATYVLPPGAAVIYQDSVEILEQKYPIQVRSWRFKSDTGGAGRSRGGLGVEVVYGPRRDPLTVAMFAHGIENPPRGVRGGANGSRPGVWRIDSEGNETELPPVGLVELAPGEWIRALESGGGGYGDPLDRDPDLVRNDVEEDKVSLTAAREVYGVAFRSGEQGSAATVDESATARLREELRVSPQSREGVGTDPL